MKKIGSLLVALLFSSLSPAVANDVLLKTTASPHDLVFDDLANVWDEAMPLGNGNVGALVWQKGDKLRIALDRSDLWDVRSLSIFEGEKFTFDWVYKQVLKKDYNPVLRHYQIDNSKPVPTKIPGAALEFDLTNHGELKENHLYLNQAVNQLQWNDGTTMQTFVHATAPLGWFVLDNGGRDVNLKLVPPSYQAACHSEAVDHSPSDLAVLGYPQGNLQQTGNKIVFHQQGWDGFSYEVAVKWEKIGNRTFGVWSVTSSETAEKAGEIVDKALGKGIKSYYKSHCEWWNNFYAKSSVNIPDELIAKQYYNEVYKMGSLARKDTYPIALQGVWTADNGRMAPWHGDYHHDLNTQLSYWPFYASNHLEEEAGFVNTLWNQRETHKAYTKKFFGTNGLNVPGVCTLKGNVMGGWIQYTLGPTVSAWLAQHFYLHWQYSLDKKFLKERAYPYVKDVVTYLEETTVLRNGVRTLRLSSSPEFRDNSLSAWFLEMSNFDRALVKFAFKAASEMAAALDLKDEAAHWASLEGQLPDFCLDEEGGLAVAPGFNYTQSHRHFSHLMAIHPLGLLDVSHGPKDADIIEKSLANLDRRGTAWWCGYSFSWLASMKARVFDGEAAAQALRDFATNFCLRNTFHANGDQKKEGKSNFTYRPFTLEGNLAFAAGLQEMLLQSHTGVIRLFPAVPRDWQNVSFKQLRTIGAFLVTAARENGKLSNVVIVSEKGGVLKMYLPENQKCKFLGKQKRVQIENNILQIKTKKGEKLRFEFV